MKRYFKIHYPAHPSVYKHLLYNSLIGCLLIACSLLVGVWGYHTFEGLSWVDSFLNAAMILSGMGPAVTLSTTAGKIFAGIYALFSGLAFIAIIVILFSPAIHLFFRKIHIENTDEE